MIDQPLSRTSACACILYHAWERFWEGLWEFSFELELERDDNLEMMVAGLKRTSEETRQFLRTADSINKHIPESKELSRKLTQLLGSLQKDIIAAWQAAKTKTQRRSLIADWKRTDPTAKLAGKMRKWFGALEEHWLDHSSNFARTCPPTPLHRNSLAFFVASSSEGEPVARAFVRKLRKAQPAWEVSFWKDPGVFPLSESTLAGLEDILAKSDFGIYVLTADDKLVMRKQQMFTARINVIFELGMGVGIHGRKRSFIVHEAVHTISDLAGITTIPYRRKDGCVPSSKEAAAVAEKILKAVAEEVRHTNLAWRQTDLKRTSAKPQKHPGT